MKTLICNVGSTDQKIRIILGAAVLVTLFAMQTWWMMLGVIPIATGLLELCPLYSIFGINTTAMPKKWWQ
jgi:hypothetical protein